MEPDMQTRLPLWAELRVWVELCWQVRVGEELGGWVGFGLQMGVEGGGWACGRGWVPGREGLASRWGRSCGWSMLCRSGGWSRACS